MTALSLDMSDRENTIGWEALRASIPQPEHPRIAAMYDLKARLEIYRLQLDHMADAYCAINSPRRYFYWDEISRIDSCLITIPAVISDIRLELLDAEHRAQDADAADQNDTNSSLINS